MQEIAHDLDHRLSERRVRRRQARVQGFAQGPVEAVGDGIDECGLTRAGRALQEEQPPGGQLVEVHVVAAGEGADGLDPQAVDPHQALRSPARAAS